MNFKRRYFIIGLVLLVLLTISAVSASENVTWGDENPILSEDVSEEVISSDEVGEVIASDNASEVVGDSQVYDARIIARDMNWIYDEAGNEFSLQLRDMQGNPIDGETLQISWSNGQKEITYYGGDNYNFYTFKNPGNYRAKIFLIDSSYSAKPVTITVNVLKAPVKMIIQRYIITINSYTTFKAIVKDQYGSFIHEGIVRFIVGGKSYYAKVNNGIAIKKVKLDKTRIYPYRAIFSSKHYKTVSRISRVFVYIVYPKDRIFNINGYKAILSMSQYKKLIYAKHNNKLLSFKLKTNGVVKQTYEVHYEQVSWKFMGVVHLVTAHSHGWMPTNIVKHWVSDGEYYTTCNAYKKIVTDKIAYKTVNARVYMNIVYGGKSGGQYGFPNRYTAYLITDYQNPGYDLVNNCWVSGTKISYYLKTLNNARVINC